MNEFYPGDRVYYHVRGGWGGGQTFRLIAVVKTVTEKKAWIVLWNERTMQQEWRQVAQSSLTPREGTALLDQEIQRWA